MKAGTDNRHERRSKSQIVRTTKPTLREASGWVDDGRETPPKVNASFARNVRPGAS
jgi:hypothetical protein